MTEEQALEIFKAMGLTEQEIEGHNRRIRSKSKGYWSEPDALEYIKDLENKDRE